MAVLWVLFKLACVASVSARVHREKLGQEQKKECRGMERGTKETLARKPLASHAGVFSGARREEIQAPLKMPAWEVSKPHDFEKLRSSTNAASDWCGAGSVDYLALETSIKPGMLCLRTLQIWSYLICGRRLQLLWTDLSRVCAKVYEISKVYWEI